MNGTSENRAILKAGFAWHFKKDSNDPDPASLEDEAKRNGAGLWSDPRSIPPWDYRKSSL
ncbi:MAG: thermonuclease family protein [Deltaproteobacteria bacterium]|nr:thermonuclease family protein [Deltaproteobacteria bacterium]